MFSLGARRLPPRPEQDHTPSESSTGDSFSSPISDRAGFLGLWQWRSGLLLSVTSWVCVLSLTNSSDKLGFILNTGECCLYTFYLHISEKTLIPSKVTRMTLDTTLYGYTIDLVITNEHGDLLSLETRHVCSSSTLHGKQEGLVLKVLLSYITNLRPP